MGVEEALHGVAEVERAADRFGTFVVSGNPEGEERRVDAAFLQARNIDVAHRGALGDVGAVDQDALRRIDVAVDADDGLGVEGEPPH